MNHWQSVLAAFVVGMVCAPASVGTNAYASDFRMARGRSPDPRADDAGARERSGPSATQDAMSTPATGPVQDGAATTEGTMGTPGIPGTGTGATGTGHGTETVDDSPAEAGPETEVIESTGTDATPDTTTP
jgi:hypothetical protein